jgi:outer membrane protein TolC
MIALLVSRLLIASAPACGPLDLDTAIGVAMTRSDEIAIKQAELASARADASLARAVRYIPSASATLVVGPSPEAHGNGVNAGDPGYPLIYPKPNDVNQGVWKTLENVRPFGRLDVQAVQPLYTWGRLDAAGDAASAGVAARTELVQDTASQIQLRVQQLYWGIALAKKLLAIANDVQKALNDASQRVTKLLAEGDKDVAPSDQYRVEVFKSLVIGRSADAQKGLELAQIGLAATLGIPTSRLQLKEVPLDPAEGDLPNSQALLSEAERQRPDLHALDDAILARGAEVKAEHAAMLPQFFLAGQLTYATAPNRDPINNPWVSDPLNMFAVGAVLGLKQDLSFPTLSAHAQKAEAERNSLQRQRDGLVRLVQVQVDTQVSEVKAARARFVAAKSSLGAGRSLFRSSSLDFAAGLLDAKALIDAYGVFVESQVGAAQAAYDLVLARARMGQVTGEPPKKAIVCEP